MHRIQNPAVNRLQTVPDVRQSTADDNAHGVVDVAALHLAYQLGLRDHLIRELYVFGFVISFMCHSFLASDIQIAHILGVALDPFLAGLDLFTHQDREDLIGQDRIPKGDPTQ